MSIAGCLLLIDQLRLCLMIGLAQFLAYQVGVCFRRVTNLLGV